MGKIESALHLAKEARAKDTRERPTQRRSTDFIRARDRGPAEWSGVAKVQLDYDQMTQHRITLGLPERNSASMAYNMLRTRLIRRMRSNEWRSVIVTSPNTGAGKSVTAINLAISISREHNQTAYLVDLDLREPCVHHYFGVKNPPCGLSPYLQGTGELDDVIVDGGISRLYFAFNDIAHQHSAELLTSKRMLQFVDDLRTYDPTGLVIYDMPPVLVADDALAFLPHADTVLLVAAQGETKRDELEKSIILLEDANLLGVVLNKSVDFEKRNVYY